MYGTDKEKGNLKLQLEKLNRLNDLTKSMEDLYKTMGGEI
jgi:hypothetical protein